MLTKRKSKRNINILVKLKKEIIRNKENNIASPGHILSMSIHHGHHSFDLFRCKFRFIDFYSIFFNLATVFCSFFHTLHQTFHHLNEKLRKEQLSSMDRVPFKSKLMSFIPKRIFWGQVDYFMYSGLTSLEKISSTQLLNRWNFCMDPLIIFNLLIISITSKICEVISQFSTQFEGLSTSSGRHCQKKII